MTVPGVFEEQAGYFSSLPTHSRVAVHAMSQAQTKKSSHSSVRVVVFASCIEVAVSSPRDGQRFRVFFYQTLYVVLSLPRRLRRA